MPCMQTRAAVEEGILPGGGVALLRAVEALKRGKGANDDQKHGIEIVKKAITWPARQIAINSGEDGSIVVSKILETPSRAFCYDRLLLWYSLCLSAKALDHRSIGDLQ